jgi:hypothetical protein
MNFLARGSTSKLKSDHHDLLGWEEGEGLALDACLAAFYASYLHAQ